jgi:hypothetical protein
VLSARQIAALNRRMTFKIMNEAIYGRVKPGSASAEAACQFYPPTTDIGTPTAQVRFVPMCGILRCNSVDMPSVAAAFSMGGK